MRLSSCISCHFGWVILFSGILLPRLHIQAQDKKVSLEQTVFSTSAIRWNRLTQMPADIKLDASVSLSQDELLAELRSAFDLPDDLQFIQDREIKGMQGDSHIRYKLYYKGLELARTQYILHLEEGRVRHAHGQLAGEPTVELAPTLSREEAFRYACGFLELNESEARKNAALTSRLLLGRGADQGNGKLMLSSGFKEKKAEDYSLVYCFDMTTRNPFRRYDVEIDAHNGDLVGKYPTLYQENIPTTGNSMYNGEVDIVISDTISKEEWPDYEAHWHMDAWNAYLGSGTSWWMADTDNFNPGGYENDWHVALETDPIDLTGSELLLTFYHRYALEDPAGAYEWDPDYDGWDGINVRISKDDGLNWEVLRGPVPAYTCTSLWSFGEIHKEGPGIPGWAGRQLTWTRANFDLSDYTGSTVRIRFDFASDGGWDSRDDNTLFGWQIDEIQVANNSEVLYSNSGTENNIRPYSIANWVGTIEGRYRLRETTRGRGIATINAENGLGFVNYVDFVQDTFPITNTTNRVGVSIHWATERTYDYFLETFGRNSYDDDGGTIISYADWIEDDERNNAFWTGSFAAYGAGDGVVRGSYGSIDVVGHEISHGLTDYSANLVYRGESGALNESFSDIFGAAVEFYAEGRDQGDWLMGEDIYIGPGAIRSMQNPKAYSDPDTYLGDYWFDTNLSDDNGGVHINSGVQNHWFYLLTEGGSGENDDGVSFQVTGIGLEDAGDIAYRNLTHYLLPDSRYMDAASYSIQAALDLFGDESQQLRSVRSAWEAVGIYMDPRLTVKDTLLQFESQAEESDYRPLILRNKGIETLSITNFVISDPDHFAFQPPPDLPRQIEGGDSLQIWMIFSPESDSLYEGTLSIEASDPLSPVKTIYLSGLGIRNTTGLSEIPEATSGKELSVSPNPFSERLLVSYALSQPEPVTIEIRDITGKLIYRTTRQASGKETLEILWSDLPGNAGKSSGGIFLFSLRTSSDVLVKKLIRQ